MKTLVKNKVTLPENQTGRVIYLDILKTIAIMGVLLIHITSRGFTSYDILSIDYFISGLISCAVRFSVPVFVMVSGALFLNENKEITVRKIFCVYIPRILAALILFALFYEALPVFVKFLTTGVIEKALIDNAIYNLTNFNTHFHLYYLYIIIIIYMLVPVIKIFLKSASKRNIEYLILFMFAFAIFMPMVKTFYPFSRLQGGMTNQYMINLTYGMLFYFLLGHYLNKYTLNRKTENIIIVLGIVSAVATFLLTAGESLHNGEFAGKYIEAMTINVSLMASGLFLLIKRSESKIKSGKFFAFISKASFLIYLIHDFYNMILELMGLTLTSFTPILSIPILLVSVMTLSILTYLILRKIPGINKIL